MPTLFDPITIGAIDARNRIFMAPLTRGRASRSHVPTPLMAEYYAQRAGAGLIITEATGISQQGLGWARAPGIWSREQVAAWKPIVKAVHDAGGRIVSQLWHMGRLVHPDFLGGQAAVSASATLAPGHGYTNEGPKPYATSRALQVPEIRQIVRDYVRAAENALQAGFDGVQLHGANGYLIDQFLRDGTNHRQDEYGGSVENRTRLLREVTQALVAAVGRERTGVRLSPNDDPQGCGDSQSDVLFTAAARLLDSIGVAFLEMRAARATSTFRPGVRQLVPAMRGAFGGPLVLNSDYHLDDGSAQLRSGEADAIAFGRTFLANPDLPERLRRNAGLNAPRVATFYTPGHAGYTDYPRLRAG